MRKIVSILNICMLLLLFACNENKRAHTSEDISTKILVEEEFEKPDINVYIENSGSMDGYMKGYSDFKDAVGNFLTDIKISGIANSFNLFFINKNIIKINSDVDHYLEILTNSCNAPTSDIALIFQKVLVQTNDKQISIFVTDGIFSPEKGKDASTYLKQQQKAIKETVAKHLQQFPKTVITVYQLNSIFNGIYYNCNDAPRKINAERPYYIWIIGNVEHISKLKAKVSDDKFKGGGVRNSYTQLPSLNKTIHYAILNSPKYGSFERDKDSPKIAINNIEKATKGKGEGKFMFTIGMDLSDFQPLLGNDYLMAVDNYACLINKQPFNEYCVEIMNCSNPNTNYTHNMKITTDKIMEGDLKIALQNNFPEWIEKANDSVGITATPCKTFGIKYLVKGISEAYNFNGNTIYSTMNFNLKK
jgi:hypothetical protein